MDIKFRIDKTNPRHTTITVFQDGGNCGTLTMETYSVLILAHELEQSKDRGGLINFTMEDWDETQREQKQVHRTDEKESEETKKD